MIEPVPKLSQTEMPKALKMLSQNEYTSLFKKIDDEYLYWDKVKYLAPEGVDSKLLWHAVKLKRKMNVIDITFGDLHFHFTITGKMQQLLHEFDMNFGGNLGSNNIIPEKDHEIYLVSSVMEEAIASSQMEGASTTRKVAKEMLRKQTRPMDKSQQMIVNNYSTIHYLAEHKDDRFSIENLLNIHRLISSKTLERPSDEGAIRTDDKVCVMNSITGEIVHTPPRAKTLKPLLEQLCSFANNNDSGLFIHPIIKGIIIHFLVAYFHPFVDGNGRTSRSLFYWYMLKNGYWLTEYLSISRVIYKNKAQYEKSFLYTEHDGLDISYFINYHLNAMKTAYEDLKSYLQKKINEQNEFYTFRNVRDINERQAQIAKIVSEKPKSIHTAKEISNRFTISTKTARTDLQNMVKSGLLTEVPVNKRMVGYMKSDNFENILKSLIEKQRKIHRF